MEATDCFTQTEMFGKDDDVRQGKGRGRMRDMQKIIVLNTMHCYWFS